MNELNLKTYNSDNIVKWYTHSIDLMPSEKHVFEIHKDLILNGSVLDIGIGGGRTTSYLIGASRKYTGIDYSQGFVDVVKKKYPKADIRLMNAINLSEFSENSFDFVNFSFNGIDYVGFEERKKVFSEIQRVLKPNGIFFFSSHNKNHVSFNKPAWQNPNNSFLIRVKTFLKLLPFLPRHIIQKKKETHLTDFAIINDNAHNYRLFTFYTTPSFLKQQLWDYKFTDIVFFSQETKEVTEENLDEWIFVTCKKSFS